MAVILGRSRAEGSRVAAPTNLLVLLGSLRETLHQKRTLLGNLMLMVQADVLEKGVPMPAPTAGMVDLARRIGDLDALGALLEPLVPYEAQVRALAAHSPIAAFTHYDLPGPADGILDERAILMRAHVHRDLGPECQIDIAGKGMTRFALVSRSEIVGVARLPRPVLPPPSMFVCPAGVVGMIPKTGFHFSG